MNITVSLFAQMTAFVLLIWLVNRYLWGPMTGALEQRRKQIADGLASAEQGRQDLEGAIVHAGEMETEARGKATDIIAHAEKRAREIEEAAKTKALEESKRIKQSAQSEIDQQVTQAKESLRQQVSKIAIAGAERILKREVDASVHAATLKELEKHI